MRILIVAKRYYTNKDLFAHRFGRLFHLPTGLVKKGNPTTLIAFDYKTHRNEEILENGFRMISVAASPLGIVFSKKGIPDLFLEGNSYDLVIGTGHLHIAEHAYRLSRRLGVPFVFEAYDYFPAYLPYILRPVGSMWFNSLCRKADACIAASEALRKRMQLNNSMTTIIENGFDPCTFQKWPKNDAIKELQLDPGKRYVCFIGTATEALGFGDFLRAMVIVRNTVPEATALHAGNLKKSYLHREDFVALGECSQNTISQVLSASDCGIVPYRDTLQVKYSNSCKLVEYMATGLPVVATRTGDNERILGESHPGIAFPSDPGSLAAAIIRQLQNPHVDQSPAPYCWEELVKRLETNLNNIIAQTNLMNKG